MARKPSTPKQTPLELANKQVLNQWIIRQFGFDPLAGAKLGNKSLKPLAPIADTLRNVPEGLDSENLHGFYKTLDIHLQENATISHADLLRYEQNIVTHTLAINARRSRPIVWKYFQWLSLLFVEIYLDRFFNGRENLLSSLNEYVDEFNNFWLEKDPKIKTEIKQFSNEELNKVCIQNATGSGKTLLMHVNFLQFRHYAAKSKFKHDLTRTILITPNEGLSSQHERGLKESGIRAERLLTDNNDLYASKPNGLHQIDYTEITKLGDKDGVKVIATRNLGDTNLLLVDEAHRGMGQTEEKGWFKNRSQLVENGFVFEYSATFKEAVTAGKNKDIEEAYAKSILFDYSYRYFYEDGYGKDYRIFNLPKSFEQLEFSYLTACLLSFYQQLKLYEDKSIPFAPYNLEKPLWVFVGSTVSKKQKNKDDIISPTGETISDVAKILNFLSKFLSDKEKSIKNINEIIYNGGTNTGLIDTDDIDIFAGSFLYLQELSRKEKYDAGKMFRDILEKIFQNAAGGALSVSKIKGDQNEIMLRAGQSDTPFGVINVGDASALINHLEEAKIVNIQIQETEFSESLFKNVHLSTSPINILLGSRKFVEGWDCWRVSTLGLMHVGKSEGSQIIQLFGRGVRLKGYDWSLKRSGFATPTSQPEYIQSIETLNVFGIEADSMTEFRDMLAEEELPSNDKKSIHEIPLTITYDFGKQLKILRPREKRGDGREYDFKRDGKIPRFGVIPDKLRNKSVTIDWYPRIQSISSLKAKVQAEKEVTTFKSEQIAFLDFDDLYFRLEKFKRERSWHNIIIEQSRIKPILEDATWYSLIVPAGRMDTSDFDNIYLWQEMAAEILQKYIEEYYNYCKSEFIKPRLELRILDKFDANLPTEDKYQIIVDSDEQALINDILKLKSEIEEGKKQFFKSNDMKAYFFEPHLYQPLLHVKIGSKIKIMPVSLNESEFQFVEDLRTYLENNEQKLIAEGAEVYLLRNESLGKGIGFFEAGHFYPDFLLWYVKGDKQIISFIEPHGLQHEGPAHKKIQFHKTIKEIEKRIADKNVELNSFIITPTRFAKLNWGKTIDELAEMNVLFMEDMYDEYIGEVFSRFD